MSVSGNTISIVIHADTTSYTQGVKVLDKELDRLKGKTSAAGSSMSGSMKQVGASVRGVRNNYIETSAAVRLMSGDLQNNIRAVEALISRNKTLSKAFSAAFPVVGGLAALFVVKKLATAVSEFIVKANGAAAAIGTSWNKLNVSSDATNDALAITNDKLEDQISVLEGTPVNHLKDELDEAKKSADDLAKYLATADENMKQLLKDNHIGGVSGFISGQAVTGTAEGSINSFNRKITQLGYKKQEQMHNGDTAGAAATDKQINDAQNSAMQWADQQLKIGAARQKLNKYTLGMTGDYSGAITDVSGFKHRIQNEQWNATARKQNATDTTRKDQDEQHLKGINTAHENWEGTGDHSHSQEASYWKQVMAGEKKGSEAYQEAAKNYNEAAKQVRKDAIAAGKKIAEAAEKLKEGWTNQFFTDGLFTAGPLGHQRENETISPDGTAQRFSAQRTANDKAMRDAQDAHAAGIHNSMRMAQDSANYSLRYKNTRLNILANRGQISASQYARFGADADAANYSRNSQANLTAQQQTQSDATLTAKQKQSILDQLQLDKQKMDEEYKILQMQDDAAVAMNSVVGATRDALLQFAQSATNASQVISNFAMNTLQSFNQTVVALASGQHGSWKNFGKSMVSDGEGTLLKGAEGFGLKALLGKDPTKKVQDVRVVNLPSVTGLGGLTGDSGGNGGIGGLLGKLFGSGSTTDSGSSAGSGFGGLISGIGSLFGLGSMLGFADGGQPPTNRPSIVGERGPEIFNPGGVHGTIIPNHALGGTQQNITIDARQSNPAMVQSAVTRGMTLAYAASVQASQKQQTDAARRRP